MYCPTTKGIVEVIIFCYHGQLVLVTAVLNYMPFFVLLSI